MPVVNINASLAGEASSTLGGKSHYSAVSSFIGGSTNIMGGKSHYSAASSFIGGSTDVLGGTVSYSALTSFISTSSSTYGGTASYAAVLALLATSRFDPDSPVETIIFAETIPATARPFTVQTIRIVPPGIVTPIYSVGPIVRRNPRRESS